MTAVFFYFIIVAIMTTAFPAGIERRQVLRIGVGISAGLGLAATGLTADQGPPIYRDELADMVEAASHLPQRETAPKVLPVHEQVAVRSNPRFTRVGHNAVRAYVVVHPGYLLSEVGDRLQQYGGLRSSYMSTLPEDEARAYSWKCWSTEAHCQAADRETIAELSALLRGKEGDYGNYYRQMGRLFSSLRQTAEPVIVYAEERGVYSGNKQYPELAIPDNALVVATKRADPEPVATVRYQRDGQIVEEPQHEGLVYDWLKSRGVNTIHFAGELGLSRGGGIWGACLGTVVEVCLERGFKAHGVEGAVYPTAPLDLHTLDRSSNELNMRMAKALHVETVPLPS